MQYAGAEGFIFWIVIVVISMIIKAIKSNGDSVAMPPKQKNIPRPYGQNHVGQGNRLQVPPQMQVSTYQSGAGHQGAVIGYQPQVPQQAMGPVHQEVQNGFERQFMMAHHSVAVSSQQPVVSFVPPEVEETVQLRRRADSRAGQSWGEHQAGKAVGAVQVSLAQGVFAANASQRRQRLREAYMLTELIGRPRAYDI